MSPFFSANRNKAEPARTVRAINSGEKLYRAGSQGLAWRLNRGVIRLDNVDDKRDSHFASLAVPGDILGCETMLFGCYTFSATALTQCELSPWPEGAGAMSGESMLASLAIAQQRAAEVVALRGGQAIDRVLGLIRLFADNAGQVILPSRQDIADITDLRFETISRIIKTLERTQVLLPIKLEGVHATRSFQIDLAAA